MSLDLLSEHPTPEVSERHPVRQVKFEDSAIAQSDYTIQTNPRFDITADEITKRLYITGEGDKSREAYLPRIALSRGRESGNVMEPVIVTRKNKEGSPYKVIGIITLKGFGPRNFETLDQDYRGGSNAVLGTTEVMIDANIGDFISETGASVGDTLGILSVPQKDFLKHFEEGETGGPNGKEYAAMMLKAWANDNEYRGTMNGLIRITDPERLDHRTFQYPEFLISSAKWLKKEMEANGRQIFETNYDLPPGYADHLETEMTDYKDVETAQKHARLLAYIISRNYALCVQNGYDVSFSNKDIGNLGKLHDFPIALDRLVKDSSGNMVINPELKMTKGSYKSLVNDVFLAEESLLSKEDFRTILTDLESQTGFTVDFDSLVEEKRKEKGPFTFVLD